MKKILLGKISLRLFIVVSLVSLFFAHQVILAFTAPTGVPPTENVAPPLNISSFHQVKDGGLSIGSFLVSGGSSFLGNVGIGIINPSNELEVVGTMQAERLEITNPAVDYRVYTSVSGDLYTMNEIGKDMIQMIDAGAVNEIDAEVMLDFLYATSMGGAKIKLGYVGYDDSTNNILSLTSEINGPVQIKTNNIARLTVLGDGNVGIGTIAPTEKLEVNGNIKVSAGFDICIDTGNCLSTGGFVSEINDLTDGKTGGSSVFLGTGAGVNDDGTANLNTAVGIDALNANTTGYSNTALGVNALKLNTTGNSNVALGKGTLYNNMTGERNVAVGNYVLHANTIGMRNAVLGGNALANNTTGSFNTIAGSYALYDNTIGEYNSAQGSFTLADNLSGNYNVAIGHASGRYLADGSTPNTTGDYNVFLGTLSKAFADDDQNEIVIGYEAIGNGSNTVTLGNDSITGTYLKGDVTIPTGKDICIDGGNCLSTSGGASEINDLTDGKTGGYSVFLGSGAGENDDGTDNENIGVGFEALRFNTSGYHNVAQGAYALHSNTTGKFNTAHGYAALNFNTTGGNNNAQGYAALYDNTTGHSNVAQGGYALFHNITGNSNAAVGYTALMDNTVGTGNNAFGSQTLYSNIAGNSNIALGNNAMYFNISGNNNVALGTSALYGNTTSDYNIALGYGAGRYIIDGTSNQTPSNSLYLGYDTRASVAGNTNEVVIGDTAKGNGSNTVTLGNDSILNTYLKGDVTVPTGKDVCIDAGNCLSTSGGVSEINDLTDGKTGGYSVFLGSGVGVNDDGTSNSNTAMGYSALNSNTSGYDNTAMGGNALRANIGGANNVALGRSALRHNTSGINNVAVGSYSLEGNVNGLNNTAVGKQTLYLNTSGSSNTAVGYSALKNNIIGIGNTAVGREALFNNTAGANTAVGDEALEGNTTGDENTAVGQEALEVNTIGEDNTAVGRQALNLNVAGGQNTAIGRQALSTNISGNENTALGHGADVSGINFTNAMALGYGAIVTATNNVRIGNSAVTVIEGQVAWSHPSDIRLKENIEESGLGLEFINSLNPVTFNYKADGQDGIEYTGFIAQEVEAVLNGAEFSGLNKPQNDDAFYSLSYSTFVVPLVNAVQEIWNKVFTNQEKISELEERIKVLEEIILNNN